MRILALISILLLLINCETDPRYFPPLEQEICNTNVTQYDTLVLLCLGQSNAANAGGTLYRSKCYNTYNFYQGELYPLVDPLLGANGTGGSVWSRLAE